MNESDDFYEDFDVNQTDFECAMNPGKYRRQTKEKQLYGVFAASSDEDDDQVDSKPKFSGRKKADYAMPVSFISGGIKKGNKIVDQTGKEQIDVDEEESTQSISKKGKSRGNEFAGLGFGGTKAGAQVFAGMRGSASYGAAAMGSMAWAKASGKGSVIMEMMQKMGYVHGKGLGANKQGVVEPVQAILRPGRGAIGAYGKEVKGPKFGESAGDAQSRLAGDGDDDDDVKVLSKQGNWKKSNAGKKQKVRYRTIDDVVNENDEMGRTLALAAGANVGMSGVKIIDMTGPEQRVYNDFGSFTRRALVPDAEHDRTKFDIPEMISNLNMLVEITEEDIRKSDQQLRFLNDQTEVLEAEQKRLRRDVSEQRVEVENMSQVADIIENFGHITSSRAPTLDECRHFFMRLRGEYPVEYKLYGLDQLAIGSVLPVLRNYFARWDPLDPETIRYGYEELVEWRDILRGGGAPTNGSGGRGMFDHVRNGTGSSSLSAYDHCVWESWMPAVRRAALSWSPRDNSPSMMALLELWLPLLPPWIAENLLDQIIVPRIKAQADEWDPRFDPVPIDSWLLPWRFLMGDRLMLVYSIIRQKLKKGLEGWKPGDRSAIESIRPWKDVFSAGTMHTFLNMSIVPKLELALQTMNINSADHFRSLALNDWLELINADVICQILLKNFFPRFHQCLCSMLTTPMMTGQHGREYYQLWRRELPSSLTTTQLIRNEFVRALTTLQQAQAGRPVNMPMTMSPVAAFPASLGQFRPPPPANLSLNNGDIIVLPPTSYFNG